MQVVIMKKFLAIYLGTPTGAKMEQWNALEPDERKAREKAGMEGWFAFMQAHEKAIADPGSPIGKTKVVNESGIADTHNAISGYTILHAESHEAAAAIFENHPHFSIFPGESVEIMEILPMPQM